MSLETRNKWVYLCNNFITVYKTFSYSTLLHISISPCKNYVDICFHFISDYSGGVFGRAHFLRRRRQVVLFLPLHELTRLTIHVQSRLF